jgi:hypothetical protein
MAYTYKEITPPGMNDNFYPQDGAPLSISPDGRYVVTSLLDSNTRNPVLYAIDLDTFETVATTIITFDGVSVRSRALAALKILSDGHLYVYLWDNGAAGYIGIKVQKYSVPDLVLQGESGYGTTVIGDNTTYKLNTSAWDSCIHEVVKPFGHYAIIHARLYSALLILNLADLSFGNIPFLFSSNVMEAVAGTCVDANNDIWMQNEHSISSLFKVSLLDAALNVSVTMYSGVVPGQPLWLVATYDGNHIISGCDETGMGLVKFDLSGNVVGQLNPPPQNPNFPYGLGAAYMGALYQQKLTSNEMVVINWDCLPVTNDEARRILKIDTDSMTILKEYTSDFYPLGSNKWKAGVFHPYEFLWDRKRDAIVSINQDDASDASTYFCSFSQFYLSEQISKSARPVCMILM